MSIINLQLLHMAREKVAQARNHDKVGFVDPATATGGGAGGAAGGTDPMAGAMPPMPAMGPGAEGGTDPTAAGGDPAAAGGDPMADIQPMIQAAVTQAVSQAMATQGGGGGAGGSAGGEKMKVDVNTEIYHIKKMLTKLLGALDIQLEPEMLNGDPAMDPAVPQSEAAKDPHSAAAAQTAGVSSAIGPIDPIQGASPELAAGGGGGGAMGAAKAAEKAALDNGQVFESSHIESVRDKAAALSARIRAAKKTSNNAA